MLNRHCVAGTAYLVTKHWPRSRWKLGKIRPDDPIEQVLLDGTQRFFSRIHSERLGEVFVEYPVDEHWQSGDVIEVRVRQKDMTNRVQIFKREITDTGSRVDQDVVVNEHGRSSGPGTDAPTAT